MPNNDRRENIRKRIADDAFALKSKKNRQIDNEWAKPDVTVSDTKSFQSIIEEEKAFEKSISTLSPEEIKEKRIEHIDQVRQWHKQAIISDNYLIERARQLYHNLSGDLPPLFRRQVISQRTFNRTLGKGLKSADRKKAFDEYSSLAKDEKSQYENAKAEYRSTRKDYSPKYNNPDLVLKEARYMDFATTEAKELFDANQALVNKGLEQLKKEHPEDYKAEMKRREDAEKARKSAELAKQTKEYEKQIKSYRETRETFDFQIDSLTDYYLGKKAEELDGLPFDENYHEIENKYNDVIQRIAEHREDIWINDLKAFSEDEINIINSYVTAKDREGPSAKKEEQPENIANKAVPTNTIEYDLNKRIQSDIANTCEASVSYAKTRLDYGLNYALEHHSRIDRSILMPALDELSELTVISHDVDVEYNKQTEAYNRDFPPHQKAKPWIFAKWFNTKRWQKWKKRDKEFETKRNDLNIVAQKVVEQKRLIGQYVIGLKQAGVSQAMIDKCSIYENAVTNPQITEDEITTEVLNCKQKFKDDIISLNKQGKKQEIANIYEERNKSIAGVDALRYIRADHLTQEEMAELYPQKEIEKVASTRPDLRSDLIDSGKLTSAQALYFMDDIYDFEKIDESVDNNSQSQSIKEEQKQTDVNKTNNIVNTESDDYLKSYNNMISKFGEDEIFADEYEFFNEMGAFDVSNEIKTDVDLQNSLFEKTNNKVPLTKPVEETKDTQLQIESTQKNAIPLK